MYNTRIRIIYMNKFSLLSSIFVSLVFTACSATTAFDNFSTDAYFEKAISNMKKVSLMQDLETKALMHAVYLNNVDTKIYNDGEYFFIALHIIKDLKNKSGLDNPHYTLKMVETIIPKIHQIQSYKSNDMNVTKTTKVEYKPLDIVSLDEEDDLRLSMPIKNKWSKYYRVKFKKIKGEKIELVFESDQYGQASLTSLKEE